MLVTLNHELNVTLTEEQKDILIIQLMQQVHIDAVEDITCCNNNKHSHPDDLKAAVKRKKATKTILKYYMCPDDLDRFLDSPREYTFSPSKYQMN